MNRNYWADTHALRLAVRFLFTEVDRVVRCYFVLAIIFVLGSSLLIAISPALLKALVDSIADDGGTSSSIAPLMIAMYVSSLLLSRLLGELRWFAFGLGEQRLNRRLSRRLFEHVIQLPMQFHVENKAGALGQTLTNGLVGYRWILQHSVFSFLPVLTELATMTMVLLYFGQPTFLAIFSASLVAYGIAFGMGAVYISGPARDVSRSRIAANSTMTDSILNCEAVKFANGEEHVGRRYDDTLKESEWHWRNFYRRRTMNGVLVSVIFGISFGATLIFSSLAIGANTMTVGEFVLVNAYMLQMIRLLETIGVGVRDSAQGFAFIEKMTSLLKQRSENLTAAGKTLPADSPVSLVFDDVSFSYGDGVNILSNVSFSVKPGNTVAIVGQSGCGKSSLIRLLVRLYDPDSGEILLNDTAISQISLSNLRRSIAVVPQDPVLFHDSIAYNIGFGQKGLSEDIRHAARLADLHKLVDRFSEGFGTIVGERGLKLSGGEKQRVAIARAVLKNPQLFVFDEATSSLDSETELRILRNLREISRERTTLIVAHRLSTVVHADDIIVLRCGKVVERGSHRMLMAQDGHYAAMWQTQRREELLQRQQHDAMTAA